MQGYLPIEAACLRIAGGHGYLCALSLGGQVDQECGGVPPENFLLVVEPSGGFTVSMNKNDYTRLIARFRPRLEAELAEIEKLGAENASWSAPVELDQQSVGRVSRIDAMQMQAMSQAVQRRRVARRIAIHQALKRVDEDEYGYCVECGEPIAPGRLDVDPTFATCVRCAK